MIKKQLIEKLEDLATFFTLVKTDEEKKSNLARTVRNEVSIAFHEGKGIAFDIAFRKVDGIIKEAKK